MKRVNLFSAVAEAFFVLVFLLILKLIDNNIVHNIIWAISFFIFTFLAWITHEIWKNWTKLKAIKCYVVLTKFGSGFRKNEITIRLGSAINFNFSKYDFKYYSDSLGEDTYLFPKGPLEGTHLITISILIFNWGISFAFYK